MPPRNWVEISRAALLHNLSYVRGRLPAATGICAVVKADAYGHGAVRCGEVFAGAGLEWLAVTSAEEGVRLRRAGLRTRILVLAGFAREDVPALVEHGLTPAVWDPAQIGWLGEQVSSGGELAIHLKMETGMGRLGVTRGQREAMLAALALAPGLRVEAVFSHLAASEAPDPAASLEQRRQFTEARGWASRFGPAGWHLANSEGALRFPDWGGMLARVGLALYGYSAQPEHARQLRPALSWKSRVVGLKDLPAGHAVGYGARFVAGRPLRVATIAVGYADGYRRDFSPGARVLLGPARIPAPVIGHISMDLTTVDATAAGDLALGEEVVLLDRQLPATELAGLASTIPYEILCGLSARVERVYLD